MTGLPEVKPDIIGRVTLYSTSAGGRRAPFSATSVRCPAFFGQQRREANDCMIMFDHVGAGLEPGGTLADVPIKFLVRKLVADKLRRGVVFVIWDGRDIGEVEITDVLPENR